MASSSLKDALRDMEATLAYFEEHGPCQKYSDECGGYLNDDPCSSMISHLKTHIERLQKKCRKENQRNMVASLDDLYAKLRQATDDSDEQSEIQAEIDVIIGRWNRKQGNTCPNCDSILSVTDLGRDYEIEDHRESGFDHYEYSCKPPRSDSDSDYN